MPRPTDDIAGRLQSAIESVEDNRHIFSVYTRALRDIASATLSLNAKVDKGFEAVDRRFEAVDRRFEAVDRRFDAVDRRFDKLDMEVGLVRDDVRSLHASMEKVLRYVVRDELKAHQVTDAS